MFKYRMIFTDHEMFKYLMYWTHSWFKYTCSCSQSDVYTYYCPQIVAASSQHQCTGRYILHALLKWFILVRNKWKWKIYLALPMDIMIIIFVKSIRFRVETRFLNLAIAAYQANYSSKRLYRDRSIIILMEDLFCE